MRAETRSDLQELRRVGELMTERQLLDAVRDACRWSGLLTYHAFDSRRSERGFPDVVVVGPHGVLWRELKSDRGRLTPDQVLWLDRLNAAGANAAVWRPCDWPDRILAELARVGGRCLSRSGAS
jgi:hypothetical protein